MAAKTLKPLHQPAESPMALAILMSGSGTNAVKILERQRELEAQGRAPFRVIAIVTDNRREGNNAWRIAKQFDLQEPIYLDFGEFRKASIKDPKNMKEREPYFADVLARIQGVRPKVELLALAGYELVITEPLISAFRDRIVNVHPADLSIRNADGAPVFTGNNAVRDAILAGQKEIRATTHLVVSKVDMGSIMLVSNPLAVELPKGVSLGQLRGDAARAKEVAGEHQKRLKAVGDWIIFPLTIELIATGRISTDVDGALYLDSVPIPNGRKMVELLRG